MPEGSLAVQMDRAARGDDFELPVPAAKKVKRDPPKECKPPAPKAKGNASGTSAAIQSANIVAVPRAGIPAAAAAARSQNSESQPQPPPPLNIALEMFFTSTRCILGKWAGPASELNYTTLRELIDTCMKMKYYYTERPDRPGKGALVVMWREEAWMESTRLVSSQKTWAILMNEVEERTKMEMGMPKGVYLGLPQEERLARFRIVLFP